jgi:membrane protease YdiL (CAAX protease family)
MENRTSKSSLYLLTNWVVLALLSLFPTAFLLKGAFPIFTILWIIVPLIAAWRRMDAARVGFRSVPRGELVKVTALNLGGLLILMLAFEPWSHTYRKLLELVLASPSPDTTFAWLVRMPPFPALLGMMVFSGLVTLFGEELFFRGWLLQVLQKRLGTVWAVLLQAAVFVLPNLIVAFMLPPLQGALYALVYTFLGIGLLGGWAAARTGSIWPSLISATLCNLALVASFL